MCGIVAVFSHDQITDADSRVAEAMIHRQRHRGPDHVGITRRPRFVIAHSRLRILDLDSRADQPLISDDRSIYVSFNGEIFNDNEIRTRLGRIGAAFRTTTDTETVLRLYETCGVDFVHELDGQFAICIVDERRNRMLLCRDRFAICPLYYFESTGRVYVSSSFRALIQCVPDAPRSPNMDAVQEYLLLRFVLPPQTIVPRVQQLRPAEMIVFEDGNSQSRRYWSMENRSIQNRSHEPAETVLHDILVDSICRNSRSDAPVGVFLSGGLDSSIVTSEAACNVTTPLSTVSIQLDPHDEEIKYATLVADLVRCKHTVCKPDEAALPILVDGCLTAMDHPTGARDALAVYCLANHLRRVCPDVKVVLTGTGADELFNGYRNAYFQPVLDKASMEDLCRHYVSLYSCINEASRHSLSKLSFVPLPIENVASRVAVEVKRTFPWIESNDGGNVQNAFYIITHLVGWELAIQDSMCMEHSLEPRVPFLSKAVVEWAMSIDGKSKCDGAIEKELLRRAFAHRLPISVCTRPKLPLSHSVVDWVWNHGFFDLVRSTKIRDHGLFRLSGFTDLNRLEDFDLLWRLFVLEMWFQKNVD